MTKKTKTIFTLIFLFSIYHLLRDTFTDIFGIHNKIWDFGHRQYPGEYWCGDYCKYTTFPPQIYNLIAAPIVLKRKKAGWLGLIVLLTIPFYISGWLMGSGPLFPKL